MATSKNSQPSKKRKKKRARTSKIGLFFKAAFLIMLLSTMGIFLVFYFKYGKIIFGMQKEAKNLVWSSTEDTFRQYETSIFYDATGEVISTLSGEREMYYVKYEDLPKEVVDAAVTIEDKRFFEHEGVDFIANIRAAVALIRHNGKVTQGGSTITQQLARNIFLTHEVSIERKIKEIFIASEMEKKYTKQNILEFYLNNIYYANGYYGIQAAAKGYFGKSVSELSLSEVAFLTAIPNSPNMYNPINHIENTYKRRDRILKQMYEDGLITRRECKDAMDEKIKVKKPETGVNNYVETYVYQSTIEALMRQDGFKFKYNFDSQEEKEAYNELYQERYSYYQSMLYNGGYRVYTSIQPKQQELLQQAVDEKLAAFTDTDENGMYKLQGAAVCIDNETGLVTAIVGGRSQEFKSYTFNRAYQSYRQPGSSIKPLVVYAPYFEAGHGPEEIVVDQKIEGGPKNSHGEYSGKITIRYAVETSKNTIAWDLFEKITPRAGLSYLHKMNFKKVGIEDEVPAASLGGLTHGTNVLEMAAAYATLENDGIYREPSCIVRIMNAEGHELVSSKPAESQVYSVQTSRIMTDVMRGVMKTGTGKGLGLGDMPSAGKTGTTNEKKDGWFVGYTKYYTTGVWVGYDYPQSMSDLYGNTYPGRIWNMYMMQIHEGLELKEFEPYVDNWNTETLVNDEEESEEESEEETEQEEDLEESEDMENDSEDDNDSDSDEDSEQTPDTTPTITPTPKPTEGPVQPEAPDNSEVEDEPEENPEDELEEDQDPEDGSGEIEDESEEGDLDSSGSGAQEDDSEGVSYSNGEVNYGGMD